jgi:CRP-like cAMP-binding protein
MANPTADDLMGNGLLATLREEDRARLAANMAVVDMKPGAVLQRAGLEVVDTWFPCGAALAAFCVATDGADLVEVAVVGREGAVGGIVSNGHVPSFSTATVSAGGRFLRIRITALEHAKIESLSLRHWFARYSDCLLAQVFQTAACNAAHTTTQRTAKWMLASVRRTKAPEFEMTQDRLAELLGVGRTFANRVVGQLRAKGIIATRRGVVVVLDERALEKLACGCTTAIEDHFATVLHGVYPAD